MPAKDHCEPQIIRALNKDGWEILNEGVYLKSGWLQGAIDLEAHRRIDQSLEQILLIEVKCFRSNSPSDFQMAIGQYLLYRALLIENGLDYPLYLAVPSDVYRRRFTGAVQRVVIEAKIKIVVVNLQTEEILRWIEP